MWFYASTLYPEHFPRSVFFKNIYFERLYNVPWYEYTTIYLLFCGVSLTMVQWSSPNTNFCVHFWTDSYSEIIRSNCMNSFRDHNTHCSTVLQNCSTTVSSHVSLLYHALPSTISLQNLCQLVGEISLIASNDKHFFQILSLFSELFIVLFPFFNLS